jgi:hypothetical protein
MSFQGTSHERALLGAVLERLVAITKNPVWPDFAPAIMPLAIAIHDAESMWRTSPSSDATVAAESSVKVPGSQAMVRFPGIDPRIVANSMVDFDGVSTATVIVPAEAATDAVDTGWNRYAGLAAHELFHVHQAERGFARPANEAVPLTMSWDDPERLALARAEWLALRRAVESPEDDLARAAFREAVALRRARAARLPDEELAYVRAVERMEGTARYVEVRAREDLQERVSWMGQTSLDMRRRCYDTGLAWCLMLDRFGSSDWKSAVATSHSSKALHLDEMAASLDERDIARAAALDSWKALVPAARDDIARERFRREGRLASLRSPDRARAAVRAAPGLDLLVTGFDPMNVLSYDSATVVHERYLSLTAGDATVTVLDLPAITTSAGDHPLFAGLRDAEIVGEAAGSWEWPDSRVRIEGSHTIAEGNDGLTIVLGAPA